MLSSAVVDEDALGRRRAERREHALERRRAGLRHVLDALEPEDLREAVGHAEPRQDALGMEQRPVGEERRGCTGRPRSMARSAGIGLEQRVDVDGVDGGQVLVGRHVVVAHQARQRRPVVGVVAGTERVRRGRRRRRAARRRTR